ncbi:MAG TPA: PAS domain S-box protein, partial [Armatimonadota bacterium]|nr:PAS domain S-box protein [Armatimonadota bacterium]
RRVMAGETIHSEASFTINGLQRTFLQIVAPVRRDHHILGILGVDVDITEQKRVEEGLRKTTEQIQAIIVASPLAIIALTPDGIVTMWSPAAERIFGWSAQEAIGSYLPFVPENKKAEFTALRKRVLAGDVFTGVEASRVRKDGSSIEISISTAPLRDETGRVNGIISVVEDITGRKREQRELARAEERYRSIFENAGIGIFQTTPGGRFRNVNSAMAHILGYSSPEELIREMTDIANQLYIDPVARDVIIAQLRTAEKAIRVEANFRRKDRTIITVNMIIRTVRDEAGFPSYYEGFIEDITERKRTEEALDRERAFLSTAIDILPFSLTFVSLVDHTPHVIRANKASAEFLKDSNPDNWWQLQFLTPETHTPVTLEQWPVYRSLHGEIVRSAEEIVVRSDGRETPVLLNSAPIYVGNEIVAAVAALQDITELKAADRAKNEFLAVLSHELKTPLTSILGWTQAAIGEDYAFMKEALTIIERNAKRQSHILDDLLDVSRIVYGKFYIKLTETDFWALTMQSVDDLRQTLTEHHLSLDIEPPSVSLPIYADQHRIRQVVSNLLLNAIKFTPAGGIITLRGWRGDRYAGVAVSDTGLGIDPAMIPRLFRPFHQVGRTEQTGGLGLGLALVKGIIDLHGGKVRAESAGLGKGSTFIVELPLATPPR